MAEGAAMTEEVKVEEAPSPTTTTTNSEGGSCSTPTASEAAAAVPAEQSSPSEAAPVTPPRENQHGDTTTVVLTDTPKVTNAPPKRTKSGDSLRSGPLPTIEECLFGGIPKDLDRERDKGRNNDEDDENDSFFFVPLNILRRVASQGIDDDDEQAGSHRGVSWRLLLGFLPPDRRQWDEVAEKQRNSYHSFVQELFCLEDRDIDGSELRGHHSKRHQKKGMTKKERKEMRRRSSKSKKDGPERTTSAGRSPVKFVDGPPTTATTNGELASEASTVTEDETDGVTSTEEVSGEEEKSEQPSCEKDLEKELRLSSSDILQQDPAQWNMSVREQKILERLTNHEAVNQLLVKRDCKEWNNFLENATLLDEIRKDVNRTHPHLYFYLEPNHQLGARRYGALERILFVWAKLNKGVRYVQGMNEIVGTLYYVLANDFNYQWADHAEADTYILFNIIMSEMRDIFVAAMDTADTGIVGRIDNMQNLLHLHDPQVKSHLVNMGIDASFYAVRWLTTLLSREFLLPDTIRLWDSMFASTHKENFLRYVCVTMVLKIRDELLLADFSTCLQLLQKYPSCSMDELLDSSRALWIYESQITMACLKGGLTLHQALQAIPPPEKVVMAFGLRGGVALTNREQLEQARDQAKEAVRNGARTMANAGQGFLGGARRFIQGRIKRSASTDGLAKKGGSNADGGAQDSINDSETAPPMPQRRIPFRAWSFGAGGRAKSDGDVDDSNKNNEAEEELDFQPAPSDAETV